MSVKTLKENTLTWINIDQINDESFRYLKENFSFHPLDLEDLQSEQQIPKIDTYDKYLFIILQFPQWNGATQTIVTHDIFIFIGDGYVVTIERSKSKTLKHLFYRCANNRKIRSDWMSGSSGYLLHKIIEAVFYGVRPILNNTGRHVTTIEQEVFSGKQSSNIIRSLALQRRNLLNLAKIIDPQRYIVSSLGSVKKTFFSKPEEEIDIYFDNIHDSLSNIWSIIESYKETVNGIHITVESLINRRTNKIIRTLTIISVSMMPLTLFTGLYGMNIKSLPFADNPLWVWIMFLGLAVCVASIIIFMRQKQDL